MGEAGGGSGTLRSSCRGRAPSCCRGKAQPAGRERLPLPRTSSRSAPPREGRGAAGKALFPSFLSSADSPPPSKLKRNTSSPVAARTGTTTAAATPQEPSGRARQHRPPLYLVVGGLPGGGVVVKEGGEASVFRQPAAGHPLGAQTSSGRHAAAFANSCRLARSPPPLLLLPPVPPPPRSVPTASPRRGAGERERAGARRLDSGERGDARVSVGPSVSVCLSVCVCARLFVAALRSRGRRHVRALTPPPPPAGTGCATDPGTDSPAPGHLSIPARPPAPGPARRRSLRKGKTEAGREKVVGRRREGEAGRTRRLHGGGGKWRRAVLPPPRRGSAAAGGPALPGRGPASPAPFRSAPRRAANRAWKVGARFSQRATRGRRGV